MQIAILDDYQGLSLESADWSKVRDRADVVVFRDHVSSEDELVSRLRPFEVIVAMRERTPLPARVIRQLPNLMLVATTHVRNAAIDLAAASERGIIVTGTGSVEASAPEHAWALLMATVRHIPAEDRSIRSGGWQHTVGTTLEGRTLGLLGLGRMGQRMARYGQAFGMRVLAWSENLDAESAAAHGAHLVTKEQLFAESDIVSVHLVSSERTRGIVARPELELLGSNGFLINTSRGPVVDEEALVAALRSHLIAGAGLDVFDVEPLPKSHPLRFLANTVVTPHVAYGTREMYEVFFREVVENIIAWLNNEPVKELLPSGYGLS